MKPTNTVGHANVVVFALLSLMTSCAEKTSASTQNNGAVVNKSDPRNAVVGVVLYRAKDWEPEACPEMPNKDFATARFLQECNVTDHCTGTVVKRTPTGEPFILSAAHCDPFARLQELEFTFGWPAARGRAYFYLPGTNTLVRLKEWRSHPSYQPNDMTDPSPDMGNPGEIWDIAAGIIDEADRTRLKTFASIAPIPVNRLTSQATIPESFKTDVSTESQFDERWFLMKTALSTFDAFPSARLFGFGIKNAYYSRAQGVGRNACAEKGGIWLGNRCMVVTKDAHANDFALRDVPMRLAFSLPSKSLYTAFVPTSAAPTAGVCSGDSGGPAFLQDTSGAASMAVIAVLSGVNYPCSGSPTFHVAADRDLNRFAPGR